MVVLNMKFKPFTFYTIYTGRWYLIWNIFDISNRSSLRSLSLSYCNASKTHLLTLFCSTRSRTTTMYETSVFYICYREHPCGTNGQCYFRANHQSVIYHLFSILLRISWRDRCFLSLFSAVDFVDFNGLKVFENRYQEEW